MVRGTLAVVLALVCGHARGGEVQIFGADKPVPAGGFASVSVKTDEGDLVGWQVYPAPVSRNSFGGQLDVSPPAEGAELTVMVTVVNFTTKRFDQGTKKVTFVGPAPPPDPDNPPDGPTDGKVDSAFQKKLQTAYTTETTDNRGLIDELGLVFSAGMTQAKKAATWGDLFAGMEKVATDNGVAGRLPNVQAVIQAELKAALPWQGAGTVALTPADRTKAKAEFQKVRDAVARLR